MTDHYFTEGTSPTGGGARFPRARQWHRAGRAVLQLPRPEQLRQLCRQLFNGSVARQTRPGRGDYCGTTNAGYYTVSNSAKQLNGYVHGTMDVNDSLQLYADVLASDEKVGWNGGTRYYSTDIDFGYVYDPAR